jgi:hypothetical protein
MNLRSLTTIAVALLLTQLALCQFTPQAASAPTGIQQSPDVKTATPSLMATLKKTVIFIEADCVRIQPNGTQLLEPFSGTAFLLAVPDTRLSGRAFTYLVTNRHVAQPGVEDGQPCVVGQYILRVDTKDQNPSGSYSQLIPVRPDQLPWSYPTDSSTDLAITPIGLSTEKLDVQYLPVDMLLSADQAKAEKVEEGDSVLFAGLFVQFVGQTHSEPIVREGKIAMIPKEEVMTTLRKTGEVYLIDCHVFGGNSGSPMLINLAGQRSGGLFVGTRYKLLGVVSGFVEETSKFELKAVASYAGTVKANSGIAIVVPAQKVLDLVELPALKELREQGVKQFQSTPHP